MAQRSAEAARETTHLIETATTNANSGVTVAGQVREILEQIVEGSTKLNSLISEIASASSEQADGIKQITEAVSAIDRVTQEVAANSEESAAASQELSQQSGTLSNLVGAFKVHQQG